MFDWNDLRYFLELHRSGRLLATARKLNTTHATVARHIENIERDLGTQLFAQHTGGYQLTPAGLALLKHGLELDGKPLRRAQVEWLNRDQLRFVLREGKKRQIRRMCELVGLKVVGLKRVRMGKVALGDLPQGQWRYLREGERFV